MDVERLAYMANQIGKFFAHEGGDTAAKSIADHLSRFWDPKMRARIHQYVINGGEGLDPTPEKAVRLL